MGYRLQKSTFAPGNPAIFLTFGHSVVKMGREEHSNFHDPNRLSPRQFRPLEFLLFMKDSRQTRRRFLQSLTAGPVGIWTLMGKSETLTAAPSETEGGPISTQAPPKTRVVIATRDSAADRDGKPNGEEVKRLLRDSLIATTGRSDVKEAWRSLFRPDDIIGIKVNSLAGRGLSSHPELVAGIVTGLVDAGIQANKIVVWDRLERELAAAGLTSNNVAGARALATDSRGFGYESRIEFSGEIGSCFSRLISRYCTALINVPVLKDHDLSGVSLGMKNFYGVIHNPNKYHDNNCNPYIADLCAHPFIAKKLRLVICDGLKGQYHGGPASRDQWSWPAATLITGTDPVAVDRIGQDIIDRKRREVGMASLKESGREPTYIETASKRGLGVRDMDAISKVSVS